ncbi:MAG: hypothetical protein OQK12_16780 [Motiliproteus sp.]|nr:hypothetical protein [Motiliproteus sp.]MCW9051245.1 hypothetical protein [Motiliproteus sp.]
MSLVDQQARATNLRDARQDLQRDFEALGSTMQSVSGRMANYAALVVNSIAASDGEFDTASFAKFATRYGAVMADIDSAYKTLQKIGALGGVDPATGDPVDQATALANLITHKTIDLETVSAEYDD